MRNDYQDPFPPGQLHNASEYLSDVHDKFTQLVSMLGHVAHEQTHIKQVLDEVKFRQDGSHSVLESIIESLHSAERNIVAGAQCCGKAASEESATGFCLSERPQSVGSSLGCSEHDRTVNMDIHEHASSFTKSMHDEKAYVTNAQVERGVEVDATTPTPSTRMSRNAAKRRSSAARNVAGSRTRSCENMQLNRQRFTERCILEAGLLSNLFTVCNFFALLFLYLYVQATNDHADLVSGIHEGLRNNFKIDDDKYGPEACHSPDDIMEYTQRFIVQSFEMATALIDANTFDAIDIDQCLDSSPTTKHICRLKYWKFPGASHKQNYFNQTLFHRDQLTPNNAMSVMDCAASPPKFNCINRSDVKFVASQQGNARTFGLTPEDPIILDSRMDYSYASVIPLTPIVWQARASRVDCFGFGDQYSKDILGAGDCQPDIACDPNRVTEFLNGNDNLLTGRRQSIFVTYAEPAFTCVDRRQGKEAQNFKDTSWSPWATFKDMTEGRDANKGTIRGQEIFWKFVPDTAYLQAPIDELLYRDDKKAPCKGGDVFCSSYSESVHCKDPLQDANHPMWAESNSTRWRCSYHRHFASEYVEKNVRERKNTFLTIDTSEFTMAALVITPSSIDFPDIITLLMVTFSISQSGYISASSDVVSLSSTQTQWYHDLVLLFILSTIYVLCSVRGTYEFVCAWWRSSDRWTKDLLSVFDMVLSLSVIGHSLVALGIAKMPQHVIEEVTDALKANNQQETYFDVIKTIIDYQATSNTMRDIGFVISLFLFLRLNMYLSLHPRMAILARTIKGAGDDMFHLAVYCLLLMLFLTVLAWWSFGHDNDAFSTNYRSCYMLTRMLAGESLFADVDKPPPVKQLVFFLIYIFVVFFILLNFFLAIIVNMYTDIQTLERTVSVVDNSLPVDLYDTFKTKTLLIINTAVDKLPVMRRFLERYLNFNLKGHVADPRNLLSYLMHEGCGLEETAAVTPEELLEARVNGKALFTTIDQAELCIRTYIKKVEETGNQWVLEEVNLDNLYSKGSYFDHRDPRGSRPGPMRERLGGDDETKLRPAREASTPQEAELCLVLI